MKTQNGTKQDSAPNYPSYFVGSSYTDLLDKTCHILWTDSHFGEPNKMQLSVFPIHHRDKPTSGLVFKNGEVKICTIIFMEDETNHGKFRKCYLVWHIHSEVQLVDLYKRVYGLPEWVKTKEDESMFFRVA